VNVYIDGRRFELRPETLVGQGGEAEVHDLGDGRVVKWWKPPAHPDFAGDPAMQAAAARRIAEAPGRLAALPKALPGSVVAPATLACTRKKEVVGYVMPKVTGEPLHVLGEPRWHRDHPDTDVVAILLALHDAVAALHRAGVVIGDFNDLNVLVDGARVHLIDVDSYQLPGFPCSMFSDRFVDPRLCDAQALVPVRPHDTASDWFAFAAMALRSLLHVGPWGGVARGMPPGARALRRRSVLAADVTYPRAARPLGTLPDDLVELFRAIFERDERGLFPRRALESLRLRRCTTCGLEHARTRCPACAIPAAPTIVHGCLQWQVVPRPARGPARVWLEGTGLIRRTALGPERVGSVLAGQTRLWVGDKLGAGFYRAGGYSVGFVLRPDRGVLDDRVPMPRLRGQLVASSAAIADDRAWLFLTLADAGRITTTAIVVDAQARVLATSVLDAPWASGVAGACAAGPYLFVPTDDGIVRVEIEAGAIVQTRVFAETAPLVCAADRLSITDGGLLVERARDVIRIQLT
jgi:tRNA A-37 threonylcarbamoyl transferase component Bud32